jgi:hypothetical protein
MPSKYARRHYEDIADIMRSSASKSDIASKVESLFASDNPRFDRARFRKAAGY